MLVVLSDLLVVVGAIWLLQGVRVLPGSFMTGSAFWAGAGVVAILAGAALQFWLWRAKR